MSRKTVGKLLFIFLLTACFCFGSMPVRADLQSDLKEQQELLEKNQQEQQQLKDSIENAKNEARTLANQIINLDNQIKLTELQVEQTQQELVQKQDEIEGLASDISVISDKIDKVEQNIAQLTEAFQTRVRSSYKTNQSTKFATNLPLLIAGVGNLQDLMFRYKYLKVVEMHDQKLLDELGVAKNAYNTQKANLETKKQDVEKMKADLIDQKNRLEGQTETLAQQKASKDYLLRVTKNDEATYQQLLSEIKAEQTALNNALNNLLTQIQNPGNGAQVKQGDVVGIQGNSGQAFGEHLHFGVYAYTENDFINHNYSLCSKHLDPGPYLNSGGLSWPVTTGLSSIPSLSDFNNDDYSYCSQGVCQVYGATNFAKIYASIYCPYGFHNGIDMNGSSGTPVLAAADGVAYTVRLGQQGGNGVFIFHPNGLMTLYWHLR